MKPWFIREDNVVPFPKKDTSVVRLPNVNAYPDFLTGVQDLQNHLKQGDISSDIHKKLYQDLIHRFMKTESFETPWFLREAPADAGGIMSAPQAKEKLDFVNKILLQNPELFDKIYKQLKISRQNTAAQTQKTDGDKFDPEQYLNPTLTVPEKDYVKDSRFKDILIDALTQSAGNMEEVEIFLKNYGKFNYINTDILKTENKPIAVESWLQAQPGVSKIFVQSIFNYLFKQKPDRGPGEIALAFLSPKITLENSGDIKIDGVSTELKGQVGAKGGRFTDSKQDFGTPNLGFLKNVSNLPDNLKIVNIEPFTTSASQQAGKGKINIFTHAQQLEKIQKGLGKEFIIQMVKNVYIAAPDDAQKIVDAFERITPAEGRNLMIKLSYKNYANRLLKKGFNYILTITPTKSLFFNIENFDNITQFAGFAAPEYKDIRNGAGAQISLK